MIRAIIILLLSSVTFFACNTVIQNYGGRTYRYVYKDAIIYECSKHDSRGDSIGFIKETVLLPMKEYLNEVWAFKNFWKIQYDGKTVYIDEDDTGWERILYEDIDSLSGKLIVKTVVLEGERKGAEETKMEIHILDSTINSPGLDYAPAIAPG